MALPLITLLGLRWGEIYRPAITTLAVFFISRTRNSSGFLAIVIGVYNRDRGGMGYHWYQLGELDMSTTLTRLVEEVTHRKKGQNRSGWWLGDEIRPGWAALAPLWSGKVPGRSAMSRQRLDGGGGSRLRRDRRWERAASSNRGRQMTVRR